MSTQGDRTGTQINKLVRTSILIPADIDSALRELADKGKRPLSWEIRQALEAHVEAELEKVA